MAYLINRNPAARFECLHALVKLINSYYGSQNDFTLSDVKYNADEDNVHNYCPLLIESDFGVRYCPYLQNPLSEAGCNMTNGVNCDSTKSKEVSNTINALHALGFVHRDTRKVRITPFGVRFANATFGTQEMQSIISEAVVHYGPVVGVLKQISDLASVGGSFNTGDISVGYPDPAETVPYERGFVVISAGSQDDSNTRTKSCILAWLTAGGYIRPDALGAVQPGEFAHEKYKDFLNQPHRGDRRYIYVSAPEFLRGNIFETAAPLDYKNLTKMTAALRENNLEEVRRATMLYEPIIQNRRLAIIYFLNRAYKGGKMLKFNDLINFFSKNIDLFVVDETSIFDTVQEEIRISDMAGIPYNVIEQDGSIYLKPLTSVNLTELTIGVPNEVLTALNEYKM